MKFLKLLSVYILLLVVTGCKAQPTPLTSPLSVPTEDTQAVVMTSPVSTPVSDLVSQEKASYEELVPGADTGIVTGVLERIEHDLPLSEWNLYLGRIIHAKDDETFEVARMSPAEDPYAHLNLEDGVFVFKDIQPGKYALYTTTPRGETILLIDLNSGTDIVLEVQAGEVMDLGELLVDFGF